MGILRVNGWNAILLCLLLTGLLVPAGATLGGGGQGQGQGKGKKASGDGGSSATTYSGRAFCLKATVLGETTMISDTGELPPEGGALEASFLLADVAGLVSAKACHAATVGQGNASRSEASLGNLTLSVAGNTISAGFVMARAKAVCDADGNATASGCSEISALAVNGIGIAVTGAANQENVSFLGLRIIINEQVVSQEGNCAEITVNALHIIATNLLGTVVADIIVCSAHADICCGGGDGDHAEVRDFITGGGFIFTPSGAKGNFGVAGGIKNGDFWGHLNYIDHGTGMHVKHITITGYEATGPNDRVIRGTCRIDNQDGFGFSVFVSDNGEPGTNDTFNIFLSTGYSAGGFLGGGNIQLHH